MIRVLRLALTLGSAASILAAAGSGRPAARAPVAAAVPEDAWPDCGLDPVPLAGDLAQNGVAVRASVAFTAASPGQVIACHQAFFEDHPVDLEAGPLEDGAMLAVFDNLHGRELLVSARSAAPGSTEVVRGARPLDHRLAQVEGPSDLPLGPELLPATRVDDGPSATITGICPACRGALAGIEARWRGAGWTVDPVQPAPPGVSAALHIDKGSRSGLLVLGSAGAFTLRIGGEP